MKRISIILIALLALVGCSEDDITVEPRGDKLTPEMVQEGAQVSKDRSEAGLGGMYAQLTANRAVYNSQTDYGYPTLASMLEHAGDGVVSRMHGYNHYWRGLRLKERSKSESRPTYFWNHSYKYIKLANDIIGSLDPKDESVRSSIGQAYAFRAFSYMFLAQVFQFTYKGNEDKPCVPIVTNETDPATLSNNPRATVQEVYDLILADLGKALELLPDGEASAKNFISKAVAYGLRSRAYLVMNKWAEAAADAQAAIDATSATPFTIEDCSVPNFDDVATGSNTMWGIIITEQDAVTKGGITNWTSMFTSFCWGSGGYTTLVNTYKRINTRLFDKISDTDIRKGWWAYERLEDENGKLIGYTSPAIKKAYPDDYEWIAAKLKRYPHTTAKFAPNDKDLSSKVNAVDFQLMRVEEMYYNLAEAKAMGGDVAGAKQVLENFVKTYRDPSYVCNATSSQAFQDEIYLQKRIEFWGEGISWFDMMRMKKGLDRVDVATKNDGGYPTLSRFNVAPDDPILLLQIPLSEEQANKAIEGNNNPKGTEPKDMF